MTKREPEPSDLLAKLAAGESITRGDRELLTGRLSGALRSDDPNSWDFDEVYEITVVAGKIGAAECTPFLERLLDAQEPVTVCLVLDILCKNWNRAEDYLERVMTFAVGSVWDDDLDVQERAIEILGSYVKSRLKDGSARHSATISRVVELLWQQFSSNEEDKTVRSAAYRAIRTAYGRENQAEESALKKIEKLPSFKAAADLGPEFDREAIEGILRLAEQQR